MKSSFRARCIVCFIAVLAIAGCVSSGPPPTPLPSFPGMPRANSAAAAVIAGLTRVDPAAYRGWAGACPGSDVDAATFALMCDQEGVPHVLLQNARATRANVVLSARQAVETLAPGGLLILYFSGHGGQLKAAVAGSEPDGQDETICLWDGPLRDDDVWALLQKLPVGIRVWMITDSCHSGTNYRGVHDYARGIAARAAREGRGDSAISLLHWGGCGDGQYSYGSPQGGSFTTALVDAWDRGQSYAAWFAGAKAVCDPKQIPTCAALGTADTWRNLPAFK